MALPVSDLAYGGSTALKKGVLSSIVAFALGVLLADH
jgi:hypothetical protein